MSAELGWSTGRIEAFRDGLLAIAITLLVLEIRLFTPVHGGLVLLAGISFLPFPTLVVTQSLASGTAGDRTAALFLNGAGLGLAFVGPAARVLVWLGLAVFFLRGMPRPRLALS